MRSLLKNIGRRMIRRLSSRVGQGTPEERLHRLSEVLGENGALNDVTQSDRGFKLTIHTCPYHGLSEKHNALCDMDRDVVSRLVGAKARADCRMSEGHTRCEFELAIGSGGSTKR